MVLIIFGTILVFGMTTSSVLPEKMPLPSLQTSQSSNDIIFGVSKGSVFRSPTEEINKAKPQPEDKELTRRFISQLQRSREIHGRLPITKIRRTFNNVNRLASLDNSFSETCLEPRSDTVHSKIIIDPSCLDRVITLGVAGGEKAGKQIRKFLTKIPKTNFRERSIVFEALAVWVRTTIRRDRTDGGESGSTIDARIDDGRENALNDIVACIPKEAIFPHGEPDHANSKDLYVFLKKCEPKPNLLSVKEPDDRVEIRQKLKALALSGNEFAHGVFEDMLKQAPRNTSYYAFVEALSEAHEKVATGGVECYYEINSSACP